MHRVKVTSPSSDVGEWNQPMGESSGGDSGQTGDNGQEANITWGSFLDLRAQILHLLFTKLSPYSMKAAQDQLETLTKCSFYLEIHRQDPPPLDRPQLPQQPPYMSNDTLLAIINPWKLQRMKKLANSQVKIQLTLLDELYNQIVTGREELEAAINQYDPASADSSYQQALQEKILQILQMQKAFHGTLTPGQLLIKHRLIPVADNTRPPQISLSLAAKMPVVFNRCKSRVTSNGVELHWVVVNQVPQESEQQFAIHFKILHPTAGGEGLMGTVASSGYTLQLHNLILDRCYRISVKRVDASNLVYSQWIDTMDLWTAGMSMGLIETRKRKRGMFYW